MSDEGPLVKFSRVMTRIDLVVLALVVIAGIVWAFIRQ